MWASTTTSSPTSVTIRKGEAWGHVGPCPPDVVTVRSDAELFVLVNACRSEGRPIPAVALLGGDLMRAVGGNGDVDRLRGEVAHLPVDVVRVDADGRTAWSAAHVVARRGWWRGQLLAAVNGQFLGEWDLSARAHPNDGLVDVVRVDASMSVRDRWRAKGRAVVGAHVPHPAIHIRRSATTVVDFDRPMRVWIDGTTWVNATTLTLTVEPDAFIACV